MPTIISHAIVGLALAAPFGRSLSWRSRVLGIICAMAPDADVISFRLGINYGDMLGHRGLSHSLLFAAALAFVAMLRLRFAERDANRWRVWLYLFLATASHGLLDAFTDGGYGVAFFAPFNNTRYFFPFTPIAVSPIGAAFFSARGLAVIGSELLWVWVPSVLFFFAALFVRATARVFASPAKQPESK
jgi:inner membrane protein